MCAAMKRLWRQFAQSTAIKISLISGVGIVSLAVFAPKITPATDQFSALPPVPGPIWGGWRSVAVSNCSDWSPAEDLVNFGEIIEQTRSCQQVEIRYLENPPIRTPKSALTETRQRQITETQQAMGQKNFLAGISYGAWSNWVVTGGVSNCSAYLPEPNTILAGQKFTQHRKCYQEQHRLRNIYNQWANGTETIADIDLARKIVQVTQNRRAVGTNPNLGLN